MKTETEELLTAPEIARAVKRSPTVIQGWVGLYWLRRAGWVERRGHRLAGYRLSEARALDKRQPRARAVFTPKTIKPATGPTATRPGSPERVEVYRLRFLRGEAIFHDADVRLFDGDGDEHEWRDVA